MEEEISAPLVYEGIEYPITIEVVKTMLEPSETGVIPYEYCVVADVARPYESELCSKMKDFALRIIDPSRVDKFTKLVNCPLVVILATTNDPLSPEQLYINYFTQGVSLYNVGRPAEAAVSRGLGKRMLVKFVATLAELFPTLRTVRLQKYSLRRPTTPDVVSVGKLYDAAEFMKRYCTGVLNIDMLLKHYLDKVTSEEVDLRTDANKYFLKLYSEYTNAVNNIRLEQYYKSNFGLVPEDPESPLCKPRYLRTDIGTFLDAGSRPEVELQQAVSMLPVRRSERVFENTMSGVWTNRAKKKREEYERLFQPYSSRSQSKSKPKKPEGSSSALSFRSPRRRKQKSVRKSRRSTRRRK
jgi:hypothetical protein